MNQFPVHTSLARVVCVVCLHIGTSARADDMSCKPVRDAMLAMRGVKYDARIVTTMPGRKPIMGEEIYTRDATYHQVLGRWLKTPTSPQKELAGEKSIDADFAGCAHLGDEAVNGGAADVYTAHIVSKAPVPLTNDMKIWISRSHKLPLRIESDTSVLLLGKSHTSKHYGYGDIKPPAM